MPVPRSSIIEAIQRIVTTAPSPVSDDDYLRAMSVTREELQAAFPNSPEEWYDRILNQNAKRLANVFERSDTKPQ
jgi:hypothetical protein